MEILKKYIKEQIRYAKIYKGRKEVVLAFQERAFGAARLYDKLQNTELGIQEFEKQLEKFQKLY